MIRTALRTRPWLLPGSLLLMGGAIFWSASLSAGFAEYGHFSLLGILGALVANSTGAGGGVVFIPAFGQLGLSAEQAVATSFGIQCFGMTAGALTWRHYARTRVTAAEQPQWTPLRAILLWTLAGTLPGLALGHILAAPAALHPLFAGFSVVLGLAILASTWSAPGARPRHTLTGPLKGALVLLGLVGGVITAWLSVGVGEILVILLILLRFNTAMAVAAGVMVSALAVWFATALNLLAEAPIQWPIVLFAGPAAMLGGVLARRLATWLSPLQLKRFFACWILFVGLLG
ncbi:sulfite exporter TauE/SafE family protein [Ferrimonas balearica]|uniref:sulfite exporter TauE/SafE family protein n=1 Tax=Ferrimonas balearica TaxID=44012 RepID=UPI001C999FBE|nr:sulfite exporter TauE/SafE family protein [Ferrimonas balearica]MBY5992650.1 sulfite exporter TauE/SafE family protein [Ferrimonas balearica]